VRAYLLIAALLGAVGIGAGCTPDPTPADIQRCGEYCDACSVGPCVTVTGTSGHCESGGGRRECILATEGDCAAVSRCLMDRRDIGP